MKKLMFPLVVMLLVAGCETADNDDHKDMLEASHQIYKGIETGDTALLHKYIAADAVDHGGAPDGGDMHGQEIINMLATVHNDIDNMKMDVVSEAANDDHVFTLVHMTGTTNKAVWGMPANFKIDSRSVDLVKMNDGKVVEHWGFMDQQEMMKMMQGGNSNMPMMNDTMQHQ